MFQERCKMIGDRVTVLLETASQHYGIAMPHVQVNYNLHGRAAGMATRKNSAYSLNFNQDMMQNSSWESIITNTVPHEVAHSVCQAYPHLGSGHNPGWARVCRHLGGTGERCHSEPVIFAKGRTYTYTTSSGREVNLSQQRHTRIQQGQVYAFKAGDKIDRLCSYVIAGTPNTVVITAVVPVVATLAQPLTAPVQYTGTNASRVRALIAALRPQGVAQEDIVQQVAIACSMKLSQARAYVKHAW